MPHTIQANATWYNDFGWASPSGAMYSSAADLAQFARLILRDFNSFTNTSLGLPGYVLREWLKPHSYTASNTHFVGLPWEDLRPTFTRLNGGFPFTIHAKSGSLLFYVSSLSIIPEYGMGLAVLASGGTGLESTVLADIIVQRFAAAVEAHRVQYARDTYAGVYNGTSGNISSVYELRVPDDGLGLEIVRWEAAGYDLLSGVLGGQVPNNTGAPVLRLQRKVRRQENNSTTTVSFRLFPTQVETPDTWRYAPYTQALPTTESVFAGLCGEWFGTDSGYYGGSRWI
ncbi:hypothetical protein H2199_006228 [Coniosporium tulheliwenetii]|uniref:Uncharacterized protein n=1 Tax=Coniosporium tulheliwenetii TaxID=3383036 RepID=A0ACC2YYD3_9PEZI|nr:hypothetical protein H2199_006228 [Cladosporium sp. JES 115]